MSKSKRIAKSESLVESIGQEIGTDRIDTEAGVIRGVKVLGRESSNGRVYSDQALADAAKLYEDSQVNIDHDRKEPHRERGLLEGFGVLRSATIKKDGVYADLHYLKTHPATPVFLEHAQRFPLHFGLSHNADGRTATKAGKVIVESIDRVNSVDIVRRPATNKGIFESENPTVKKTIRELIESSKVARAKTCGLLEMDGMPDMPVEMPEAASGEDGIWAAFRAAIMSVLDDDGMDTKASLKKIGEILKAYDKLEGGGSKEAPKADEPPADDAVAESQLLKQLADQVTSLAESVGKITTKLEAIEKAPGKVKPLMESKYAASPLTEYPKDSTAFAAALKN